MWWDIITKNYPKKVQQKQEFPIDLWEVPKILECAIFLEMHANMQKITKKIIWKFKKHHQIPIGILRYRNVSCVLGCMPKYGKLQKKSKNKIMEVLLSASRHSKILEGTVYL